MHAFNNLNTVQCIVITMGHFIGNSSVIMGSIVRTMLTTIPFGDFDNLRDHQLYV